MSHSATTPAIVLVGRAADPLDKENWEDDFDLEPESPPPVVSAKSSGGHNSFVHNNTNNNTNTDSNLALLRANVGNALDDIDDIDEEDWDAEFEARDRKHPPPAPPRDKRGHVAFDVENSNINPNPDLASSERRKSLQVLCGRLHHLKAYPHPIQLILNQFFTECLE